MAAFLFVVCFLCLLLPVDGEVVEHVSATRGNVICAAGEFVFTENTGIALQDIVPPSRIIKQVRQVNSSKECRNLCCDSVGCNVASYINLDDFQVCALVSCVDSLSCLWQSYGQGIASFLNREITKAKDLKESTTTVTTTTTLSTQTTFTTSTTPDGTTSGPGEDNEDTDTDDSWGWYNPFNWGRPQIDYSDEDEAPEADPNQDLLNVLNEQNREVDGKSTTPDDLWNFENEMFGSNLDGLDNAYPGKANGNLQEPKTNDVKPPGVFGNSVQPVDGIKSNEMGTSWQGNEPHEMPLEDDTTYTIGLAVFLASLGVAGILVLTIHYVSKSRRKSRYTLLEVEEDLQGDKQPFLPK